VDIDGIEPDEQAAAEARGVYRTVLVGTFPGVTPDGRYDAIVCNDVLEHMVDPWGAVAELRLHLNPGGVVVASIPNMRYWPVLRGLLAGRWDYADEGVLDRTHLRWFTKASMRELFTDAGFEIDAVERLTGLRGGPALRAIGVLARQQVQDVLTKQYVVVARAA
jgi:2-polyprenyl-3-methyl-5-hydroxy-6-metoxy-1,4-benzoquinol methylase